VCGVKALAVSKQHGIQDFKASQGWMVRTLVGNNFCIRRRYNLSEWQKKKKEKAVPGKCKAITEIMIEFQGTLLRK
jgi:hypothetical protein